VFDVVLEIVEHPRPGAPRQEAERNGEQMAEDAACSDGCVYAHSSVTIVDLV
jgi:hypothetical protein